MASERPGADPILSETDKKPPDENAQKNADGNAANDKDTVNQATSPTKSPTKEYGNSDERQKEASHRENTDKVKETERDNVEKVESQVENQNKTDKEAIADENDDDEIDSISRQGTPPPAKSRPLTEIKLDSPIRAVELDDPVDTKTAWPDRTARSPFSISIERKPLQSSHSHTRSDYTLRTSTTSRFPSLAPNQAKIDRIPSPNSRSERERGTFSRQTSRNRIPTKLIRLATVTMSPKSKPLQRGPSLYYEEPKKPRKVLTFDEAISARPPLRVDMEGPGPCSYSPRNKPLYETNSPSWTFGAKCSPQKTGGTRTSWEKPWFQTPHVWLNKVDFFSDTTWPTPNQYRHRGVLGPRQRTMHEAPSFSIGVRKSFSMNKQGAEKEPSPTDYDRDKADSQVLKKGPSFTHQFRHDGTILWSSNDRTPGPGQYTPRLDIKQSAPAFTIQGIRREKSHVLGPFSTF